METLNELLTSIRACRICEPHLPLGPNPVLRAHPDSKILIIGQAPGTKVHASGIPWNDASGKRLRDWLSVTSEEFYDETKFAIVPMGFCYPGKGKSGDLAPRPECANAWHSSVLQHMPKLQLTLLIGQYAQEYYLSEKKKSNLTETVKSYEAYLPSYIPLPHPSPRNQLWLKKNPWFQENLVPVLRSQIQEILYRHEK